jgi:hypothetical protein
MHHHRKPNWPSLVITIAVLATVALLFWAAAGDALLEMREVLSD